MRTTTMLEVMAEVGTEVRREDVSRLNATEWIDRADSYIEDAYVGRGPDRRKALVAAASYAILALHAHDAEAAALAYNPGPEGA